MASNNRKTPQRCPPKNNDDRNRHPASRVQQTGGSLHAKRRVDNKKVQETLDDMFVNVFDSEIIRSVAHSCGWKLNKSIEALIMLAEGSEFPSIKLTENLGNSGSSHSPVSSCSSREKLPSMSKSKCGKESNNIPGASGCYKSNMSSKNKPIDISKTKSVMMNTSQGTFKVTYKGRDDPDLSDDDADIVIEEENECDISELDIGFTDVPNQSVCQFLAPSVSHDQPLKRFPESLTISPRKNIPLSTSSKFTSKDLNLLVHKSASTFDSQVTSQVKKTKHWPKFERIKKEINEGIKVMILMRGCPGSGKTSLARHIVKVTYGGDEQNYIFSTDHYFVFHGNGKYLFDPRLLPTAHEWNQNRVKENACKGINPIIIDNTNLEVWEMEPYAKIAVKFGYNLELLEPRTSWRNNSYELERKNSHNVPRRKIEGMLARFDRDLTTSKLLSLLNLKYSPCNAPPQQTSQPKPSLSKSDMSLSGAKKKSIIKKKEEKLDESASNISVNSVRNVKPIQLSVELGCDIADKEIKESVDMLVSEWNRSVNSQLSGKGNADMNEPGHYSPKTNDHMSTEFHEESDERKVFDVLNTKVTPYGGEEMGFKNCSTENSEEELDITGVSDEWEDESEDEDTMCSNATFLDIGREIIGTVISDKKEETQCMEYALVLKDGTLLPQRSYYKENSCSGSSKENERKWEYLLMADDSELLFNHPKENSSNGRSEVKDCTETMNDGVVTGAPTEETLKTRPKESAKYIFMENWEEEKSQLESFLFPDVEDESIIHSKFINQTISSLKDPGKKENSVACGKTNQSLDKLITESAASLNIDFAGVDDTTSSEGSQPALLLPSPSNENIESVQSPDNPTRIVELSEVSATEACVPTGETSDNSAQIKAQTIDEFTGNNIYCSVEVKTDSVDLEGVLNKEHSESYMNSDRSEGDHSSTNQAQFEKDNRVISNNELKMIPDEDIFHRNRCSELNTKRPVNDILDIDSNLCILNTNKSNMNEQDVMEKWAEGKSWDDQEGVNIKMSVESSAPKPARNYKRPFTAEASPKKDSNGESLGLLCKETIDESWCAVDEPISSWKEKTENDDKDVKKPEGIEPQPQRQMFAVPLKEITNDKEKCITVEEMQDLSDSDERMKDHGVGDVALAESANIFEDLIQFAVSEESKNVGVSTNFLPTLQERKQTVPIPENIFSVNDLFAASCSHAINEETKQFRNVAHSSTNTHHSDFITLSNVNMGSNVEDPGIKVLPTIGRNIIDFEVTATNNCRKVGQVLMLDKSSMTYDIISSASETENMTEQLQELVNMFPHCSLEDLQEIFEKCNKDINWTVDLLLESANQGIGISTVNSTYRSEPNTDIIVNINSIESKNETQNFTDEFRTDISNNEDNASAIDALQTAPSNSLLLTLASHDTSTKSPSQNKRNGKKDRASVSEMSLLLKKQLEENIVINDEHYSEHVSRIRKLRHGELTDATEVAAGGAQTVDECFGEYSQQDNLLDTSSQEMSHLNASIEPSYILRPDAPEWEVSEIDFKALNEEEEETVPVKMDVEFAEQLHCLFGTANLPFKQDLKPTLNLPLSLARQLHYYMMEAEQSTYDLMMQEDEELARKLQVQENVNAETVVPSPNQVPDLREIMDMEMALALYKADQKQNITENKEDLATKLTKNLLCEWFPSLPRDVLVNVFEAHNNSFEDTLEVLLASTGEDTSVRIVLTPEARAAHEQALLMKASQEGEKSKESSQDSSVVSEIVTQDQALQDADFFRSEASRHYSLRNECQQKAQRSYQRGLTAAAAYYSQMASLHKRRIEESNAKAASSLLLAHSLGNLSSTLDLHFLYVVEALQVLDMFLDHHIHQLTKSSHRSVKVFVITGRGARSTGGRSRIKPAVVQRLEQRSLRHEEVNPGLLKVIITRTATSSTRITS